MLSLGIANAQKLVLMGACVRWLNRSNALDQHILQVDA